MISCLASFTKAVVRDSYHAYIRRDDGEENAEHGL